jgi:RND family efflux transporter MFP subunit
MTRARHAAPFVALALLLVASSPALAQGGAGTPPAPDGKRPAVTVQTSYPGANASVVADIVAAPVEQQVNGVERMAHMISRCGNDGSYSLTVTFQARTDPQTALTLVRNRAALAVPLLPDAVRQRGVAVRPQPPGPLLFVTLFSPDGRFDTLYLSNYAAIQLRDELARVPGAGDVALVGAQDYAMRVWLDPDKMAAREVTAADVIRAIRDRDPRAAPGGWAGEAAEELGELALKAGAGGSPVRLRDVARCELGARSPHGPASLDGRPAAVLAVSATPRADPRELSEAVREKMARLKESFPPGVDYALVFDLTPAGGPRGAPDYLLVELGPANRAAEAADRSARVLSQSPGVSHVLTLPENPFTRFGDGPCLLALLEPRGKGPAGREEVARAVRERLLKEVPEAGPRVYDRPAAAGLPVGPTVDLAVYGPEHPSVRELADGLVERLARTNKLVNVAAAPAGPAGRAHHLDINRAAALAVGASPAEVAEAAAACLGPVPAGELRRFGRGWPVAVQVPPGEAGPADALKRVRVRNDGGKMVPLSGLVKVREVDDPGVLARFNMDPMVGVTADPAPGVSLGEARGVCEALAEEARRALGLPPAYRLAWLRDMPAAQRRRDPAPAAEAPAEGPADVPVARPVVREVTDYEDFTGRAEAASVVEVRARVTGYLDKVLFKEGAEVKQGDVLFLIDPRPYQAELDRARAEVARCEARLRGAAAAVDRAGKAASPEEADRLRAEREDAEAAQRVARADLELRKLNLEFTKVAAPVGGLAGRRLVDVGNLVKADDTLLTTLVSLDPAYAAFDVDERTLLRLLRLARGGVPGAPRDMRRPVQVGLADEEGFPHRGVLDFIDNRVDPNTGTVRARAALPNPGPGRLLRPGLSLRVRLPVSAPYRAVLVADEALGSDVGGRFLYLVDGDNKVVQRRVRAGAVHDGLRVVAEGLQPDDRVIVGGLSRLRPGTAVRPREVEMPTRKREEKP